MKFRNLEDGGVMSKEEERGRQRGRTREGSRRGGRGGGGGGSVGGDEWARRLRGARAY